MGLTPNPPPDDGTLRMSGVPPSGPRSTRGFQPLTKPVAGLRPLGSRSLTRGRRAFPLPPQQAPTGIGRAVARFPQFRRAQSPRNSQLLSQVRSTKSAPPARRPCRCFPLRPCPPLTPRLPAWQAVWRGHPPSRILGALPMKAPAPGSIRLGNKRAGAPGKPGPGEIAVDIDRKNRVLGNPFVLHNPSDAAARNDVIERFRAKYEADLKCDGPMSAATEAL